MAIETKTIETLKKCKGLIEGLMDVGAIPPSIAGICADIHTDVLDSIKEERIKNENNS